MRKPFLVTAMLAGALWGSAQELTLSLRELFDLAETGNSEIRANQIHADAARQGIDVAQASKLPDVTAALDLSYIGDGTIIDRDFSRAMRDKLPHFGNALSVNVYQPLFTGGAITGGIEMAQHNALMADINLSQTRSGIRYQLTQSYLNLYKMLNLRKVYQENIEVTNRLIDNMRARHEQGTVLKNDITRFELRLSSLTYDLQTIENSISILNNNMVTLLGVEAGTKIMPDTTLIEQPLEIASEADWMQIAYANSQDLQAVDAQKDMARTSLKLAKADLYPTIGVYAADNLSGPVTFEIPAINKNYNFWTFGLSVSYKLSSLYKTNKKIKQSTIDLAQAQEMRTCVEDALERKIHEAYVMSVQAQQMLATETTNVALATENYRIVDARFANDMALLTDMLDASTTKLDAETRLVNARISAILSYYQLKYISGTL